MKKSWGMGFVVLLAAGLAQTSPASAQSELERLESGIRSSNGQPPTTFATPQHGYLGAVADDDAGHGVRVLSVRAGGPADRAGLHAQDLVVGAAGRKIHLLSDLTAVLSSLNPGDRLPLELFRGNRPLHIEVVLAAPPGAAPAVQPGMPPLPGPGTGRSESIPPPPGEVAPPPAPSDGPALLPPGNPFAPNPQPVPPNSPQAQIDQLRQRVDQLERRVQELEHALAESQKTK